MFAWLKVNSGLYQTKQCRYGKAIGRIKRTARCGWQVYSLNYEGGYFPWKPELICDGYDPKTGLFLTLGAAKSAFSF